MSSDDYSFAYYYINANPSYSTALSPSHIGSPQYRSALNKSYTLPDKALPIIRLPTPGPVVNKSLAGLTFFNSLSPPPLARIAAFSSSSLTSSALRARQSEMGVGYSSTMADTFSAERPATVSSILHHRSRSVVEPLLELSAENEGYVVRYGWVEWTERRCF